MYDELFNKVMSQNVTLQDWKNFREYFEAHRVEHPGYEYGMAAKHCANSLPMEDILKDSILMFCAQ